MNPSNYRRKMMLAVGLESYVPEQDHFIIARNFFERSANDFYATENYGAIGFQIRSNPKYYYSIKSADCYNGNSDLIPRGELNFYFNNRVMKQDDYDTHFLSVIVVRKLLRPWDDKVPLKGNQFLFMYRRSTGEKSDYSWAVARPPTKITGIAPGSSYSPTAVALKDSRYSPNSRLSLEDLNRLAETLGELNNPVVANWHAAIVPKVTSNNDDTILDNTYEWKNFFNINFDRMNLTDAKAILVRAYLVKFSDSPDRGQGSKYFDVGITRDTACLYIKAFEPGPDGGNLLAPVADNVDFAAVSVIAGQKCVQ